jgi:DNA ligase 1
MSSPAKKRKLNNGSKTASVPSKGLEYFFSKQTQKNSSDSPQLNSESEASTKEALTDEELARKLQDEWNKEIITENVDIENPDSASTGGQDPPVNASNGHRPNDLKHVPAKETPETDPPEAAKNDSKKTLTLQSAGITEDSVTADIPLDESPLTFDPSQYIGRLQQHWASEGGDASYALLTRCFVLVSSTTSRIKTVDTLVNCLRILIEGDPSSLLPAVRESFRRY